MNSVDLEQHTIIMFFYDHKPVRFVGNEIDCALQVANAMRHPGFVSWEQLS